MKDRWSDWIPFQHVFEYYGLVDDSDGKNSSRKSIEYLGKSGKLHQDDGFRLRSNKAPASGSHVPLVSDLEEVPCPLTKGDIGCYWIKICVPGKLTLNYIGQCTERDWGISKRLTDHFRKLCAIPDSSELSWDDIRGVTPTKRFSDASWRIKEELGIDLTDPKTAFFEKYVELKLITVADSKTADKKIHRIEGMALAAFRSKYGEFPELNDRDETIGLEGLFDTE